MTDPKDIINAPGYGTGKAARDRWAAEAECKQLLPDRRALPVFVAGPESAHMPRGIPAIRTGFSGEDNEDWCVWVCDGTEADAIGHDAKDDARVVAAILNAYRLGVLTLVGGRL